MEEVKLEYLCPVCGYNLYENLNILPWSNNDSPSHEICSSCGIQFGYQDLEWDKKKRTEIYKKWRQKWMDKKMQWHSVNDEPKDWNPKKQLEQLEQLQKLESEK